MARPCAGCACAVSGGQVRLVMSGRWMSVSCTARPGGFRRKLKMYLAVRFDCVFLSAASVLSKAPTLYRMLVMPIVCNQCNQPVATQLLSGQTDGCRAGFNSINSLKQWQAGYTGQVPLSTRPHVPLHQPLTTQGPVRQATHPLCLGCA